MSRRRIGFPLVVTALLSACGSRGPGLQGPEAVDLFRSFSGTWELDEGSSSDPPTLAQPPLGGRAPAEGGDGGGGSVGGGGRAPGGVGGRTGGRAGSGRPGEGRGTFRGAIDTEAIFAVSELARNRPETVVLALTDSLFVTEYVGILRTEVPMNGREAAISVNRQPGAAWVEWRERKPRMTWEIEDGGVVTDRFEVLPTGRLALSRLFNNGFGGDIEVRFVYSRRGDATR